MLILLLQVKVMKESSVPFSSPTLTAPRSVPKIQEQQVTVSPTPTPGPETNGIENGNNQDGEGTYPLILVLHIVPIPLFYLVTYDGELIYYYMLYVLHSGWSFYLHKRFAFKCHTCFT